MKRNQFPRNASSDDIEFIFKLCTMSPYVKKNPDYAKKANATRIKIDPREEVNAYAQSLSQTSHQITMLGGILNVYSMLGISLAHFKKDNDIQMLINACNWICERCEKNSYKFSQNDVNDGLEEMAYIASDSLDHESRGFFTGLTLSVTAHELGHICMSHTLREEDSNEISRNDERQADLFAQSVVSTTPFAGYLVLSSLFTYILFAWMDKNSTGDATTHPYSKERVMNTLNSHEKYLADLGITKDNISEFLP